MPETTIQEDIQAIKDAVYGEDVRYSIWHAIENCYNISSQEYAAINQQNALSSGTNLNSLYDNKVWLLPLSNSYSNLPPSLNGDAAFLFVNTVCGWTVQILYTWDDGPIWKRRGKQSSNVWERWIDLTQNDKLNALSEVINILLAGVEDQYTVKGTTINSSKSTDQAEINSQGAVSVLESGGTLYKVFEYSVNPSKLISINHTYRAGSVEYCFLDIHNTVINKEDLYVEEYISASTGGGMADTFKKTTIVVTPYDAVKLIVGAASEDGVDPARCTVKYVKSIDENDTGGTLVRLDNLEDKFKFYLANYMCIDGSEIKYGSGVKKEVGYRYKSSSSSDAAKTAESGYTLYTFNDLSNIKMFTSEFTELASSTSMANTPVVFLDVNNKVIRYETNFRLSQTGSYASKYVVKNSVTGHWEIDIASVLKRSPSITQVAFTVPDARPEENWTITYWANTQTQVPYGPNMYQFNSLDTRVTNLESTTSTSASVSALTDRVSDLELNTATSTDLANLADRVSDAESDISNTSSRMTGLETSTNFYLKNYRCVNGTDVSLAPETTVDEGYCYLLTTYTAATSSVVKEANTGYIIYTVNDITNIKKFTSTFSEMDAKPGGHLRYTPVVYLDEDDNPIASISGYSFTEGLTGNGFSLNSDGFWEINVAEVIANRPNVSKIAFSIDKDPLESWTVTFWANEDTPVPFAPTIKQFNALSAKVSSIESDTTLADRVSDVEDAIDTLETPEWTGKKLVIIGDNISASGSSATVRYFDKIAQSTGIAVTNLSRVGGGYMPSGDESLRFYNRVSSIPSSADAIIIFGSFNDIEAARSNLGDILSSNTTTLYGCVNKALDDIITANPLVPIGVVTPIPTKSHNELQNSEHDTELVNAIIVACNRRGIPVLDLYRCSNLRPWDATFRSLAFSNDQTNGVLPNNEGHAIIAPRIKSFLDSLIKL